MCCSIGQTRQRPKTSGETRAPVSPSQPRSTRRPRSLENGSAAPRCEVGLDRPTFCIYSGYRMAANTRFAVAVHVLVALAYLGQSGATSVELANSVNTNAVVVRRILGALARAGLVTGRGGRTGGYTLARAPGRITLELVFKAVEPEGVFALHENPTNRACEVSCQIKGLLTNVFDGVQKAFEQHLRRTSIADLVGQTRAKA